MSQPNVYLDFVRRHGWLIVLGIIIAVGATNFALAGREPLYRSVATVQVGRATQEKSPDQNDLAVAERLIPVYAELAQRDPVLSQAVAKLGYPFDSDAVGARLLVTPVASTQLIDIQVVDTNPKVAAELANEIARQLVLLGPDTAPEDATQQFVQAQLVDLQLKITASQEEIAALESSIAEMTSAADIFDARQNVLALTAQIDAWQQTYGVLLAQIEPSTTNILSIANEATESTAPISTPALFYYGLAVALGAAVGALAGLLLTLLGGALRRPAELEPVTGKTPIVTVPRYRVPRAGDPIAAVAPMSEASAAYRVLRNMVRSVTPQDQGASIIVTSSRAGEGKTTTTANLGVALANSGLKVILVDTNLRFPELDTLFDLPEGPGLTDFLLDDVRLDKVVVATNQPNLSVVRAGSPTPNFADLLASPQLREAIRALALRAELVIYDTPAVLQEQETILLTKEVDSVIVVAEAGKVKSDDLERSLELLELAEAPVTLIALNKVRVPLLGLNRLPWSREARLRARRLERRRQAQRAQSGGVADSASATLGD